MRFSRPRTVITLAALVWSLVIPGSALATAVVPNEIEADFLALLDEEREAHGVQALVPMAELTSGARAHAAEMAAAGFIFHNADLGSVLADGWAKLGENVGVGYGADSLHLAFMASPGHRDNIVDPAYDAVGVGTVEARGAIYVVFVFADLIDSVAEVSGSRFSDVGGSPFGSSIEALAAAGITSGCGADRFCPDDPVTRGQMAAFLVRALDVPAVSGSRFSDVGGSPFGSSIEALAAAGITSGCGADRFCPDDPVTRGQMAAFLVRALDVPAVSGSRFSDVGGSPFGSSIEALAAAGITSGCGADRFCPDDPVTRGQMAAFLVRGLGL
jgi:hypothetical protein